MSNQPDNGSKPVSPDFEALFPIDQSSHVLENGTAEIEFDGTKYSCECVATLWTVPSPRIIFVAESTEIGNRERLAVGFSGDAISKFSFRGAEIDGFYISLNSRADGTTIKWVSSSEPVGMLGDCTTSMTMVRGALFDFLSFHGGPCDSEERQGSHVRIEVLKLESRVLNLEVRSLYHSSKSKEETKKDRIPRLTHTFELSYLDASQHSAAEFKNQLLRVGDCLSFMSGRSMRLVCPAGFDQSDKMVWNALSSPNKSPGWVPSCLPEGQPTCLREFFRCHMNTTLAESWETPLHEAIYWYLNANQSSRGIDAGIILAQAAMELLSYTFVVNERGLLTANGYKDLWASDKLRLLLKSVGIPTEIPPELTQIHNLLATDNKVKWVDLPHALTEIRNSLVHPEKKDREKFYSCMQDAYKGWLWYLELSILAVCGYSGRYRNRLTATAAWDSEPVPWNIKNICD